MIQLALPSVALADGDSSARITTAGAKPDLWLTSPDDLPASVTSRNSHNPDPKNAVSATSRSKLVNSKKLTGKPEKLQITESRRNDQQSWTVKADETARRRGKTEAYFRVRVVDSGYRVGLVYRDESGARREPYLCYLAEREWKAAKKGTIQTFARLVAEKIEQRKLSEGADIGKLDELLRRVRTFK